MPSITTLRQATVLLLRDILEAATIGAGDGFGVLPPMIFTVVPLYLSFTTVSPPSFHGRLCARRLSGDLLHAHAPHPPTLSPHALLDVFQQLAGAPGWGARGAAYDGKLQGVRGGQRARHGGLCECSGTDWLVEGGGEYLIGSGKLRGGKAGAWMRWTSWVVENREGVACDKRVSRTPFRPLLIVFVVCVPTALICHAAFANVFYLRSR